MNENISVLHFDSCLLISGKLNDLLKDNNEEKMKNTFSIL